MSDYSLYVPALGRAVPTLQDVWPATGRMFGMSRSQTYQAVKSGEIPSIRLAGRIRIPTAPLLDMLGLAYELTPETVEAAASLTVAS